MLYRIVLDFASSSGKSRIHLFLGNPAPILIWQMPVQLQYVQLIIDKTNVIHFLPAR